MRLPVEGGAVVGVEVAVVGGAVVEVDVVGGATAVGELVRGAVVEVDIVGEATVGVGTVIDTLPE